jgi:hypothetical protein
MEHKSQIEFLLVPLFVIFVAFVMMGREDYDVVKRKSEK